VKLWFWFGAYKMPLNPEAECFPRQPHHCQYGAKSPEFSAERHSSFRFFPQNCTHPTTRHPPHQLPKGFPQQIRESRSLPLLICFFFPFPGLLSPRNFFRAFRELAATGLIFFPLMLSFPLFSSMFEQSPSSFAGVLGTFPLGRLFSRPSPAFSSGSETLCYTSMDCLNCL